MTNSKIFPIILFTFATIMLLVNIICSIITQNVIMGIFTSVGFIAIMTISWLWLNNKMYSKALPVCDAFILVGLIGSLASIYPAIHIGDIIIHMVLAFMIGMIFTSHILRIYLHEKLDNKQNRDLIV